MCCCSAAAVRISWSAHIRRLLALQRTFLFHHSARLAGSQVVTSKQSVQICTRLKGCGYTIVVAHLDRHRCRTFFFYSRLDGVKGGSVCFVHIPVFYMQ